MKLSLAYTLISAALAGATPIGFTCPSDSCKKTEATLFAGQTIDVGTVTTCFKDNTSAITINYSLGVPGICINEVHAEVFQLFTDHYYSIVNKVENPKTGNFIINESLSLCRQDFTATITAEEVAERLQDNTDVYVAAHAVVSIGNFGAYGYARNNDVGDGTGIYAIDFDYPPTATQLLSLQRGSDTAFPNGLGFDQTTGNLYYVDDYVQGNVANLYAYNVFTGLSVSITNQIPGRVTDATFDPIRGKYVFIAEKSTAGTMNPLYLVDPSDPTIVDGIDPVCNINADDLYFNGDIVWRNQKVYLATRGQDWAVLDFSVTDDSNICGSYKEEKDALRKDDGYLLSSLQLAVDKNGDIIGNEIKTGDWYKVAGDVDLVDDSPVSVVQIDRPELSYGFTDLASGTQVIQSETAWADGPEFNDGKSWATYFAVEACPPPPARNLRG